MRRLLSLAVCIAWGLWLGGLITLFMAVTSIFATFPDNRPLAGRVATGIFHLFEKYQLALAAASLLATFGWRLMSRAAGLKTALFALLALTTTAAGASTLLISPRIEALRVQGTTTGPDFKRLHGTSMLLYTTEAGLLLIAGLILPSTIARDAEAADRRPSGE